MSEYKNIWVVVEKYQGRPKNNAIELLGKGRELADARGEQLVAVVIGSDNEETVKEVTAYGADVVIDVDRPEYKDYSTDGYTHVVATLIEKYNPLVVLIGATYHGRDLGGRLSARLRGGLVADCTDCFFKEGEDTLYWVRPTFDGKLFSNITISTRPQIGTVGDKIFRGNERNDDRTAEVIREDIETKDIRTVLLEFLSDAEASSEEDEPSPLERASIVVGGGRGVGTKEGYKVIEEFAAKIGGACAATKPLCDAGWVPYELQVGATGKKIKPKIYFAVGISGAIQHLFGMRDSDLIIAVNNDPEAPIFKAAHYGIVGDLFKVLPSLGDELAALKKL